MAIDWDKARKSVKTENSIDWDKARKSVNNDSSDKAVKQSTKKSEVSQPGAIIRTMTPELKKEYSSVNPTEPKSNYAPIVSSQKQMDFFTSKQNSAQPSARKQYTTQDLESVEALIVQREKAGSAKTGELATLKNTRKEIISSLNDQGIEINTKPKNYTAEYSGVDWKKASEINKAVFKNEPISLTERKLAEQKELRGNEPRYISGTPNNISDSVFVKPPHQGFTSDELYHKTYSVMKAEEQKQNERREKYYNLDEETKAEIDIIARGINAKSQTEGVYGFFNRYGGENGGISSTYDTAKRQVQEGEAAKMRLIQKGYSEAEINLWADMTVNEINRKFQEEAKASIDEFADEHPVLASVESIAYKALTSPIGVVSVFDGAVNNNIDSKSQLNTMLMVDEWARDSVHEDIAEKSELGAWLYDVGMSGADSIVAGLMPGNVGAIMLASDAMVNTTLELSERGLDSKTAVTGGVFAGIFEAVFEKYSIGQFKSLQEISPQNLKDIAFNLIKSMGVNASEEAATELANVVYDSIANGAASDYETLVHQYILQGMSMEKAKEQAAGDLAFRILEAGAAGAVMGVGMGSAASSIAYGKNQAAAKKTGEFVKQTGQTGSVLASASVAPAGSRPYIAAQKADKKLAKSNELSARDVGKVAVESQQYMQENSKPLDGVFSDASSASEIGRIYQETKRNLENSPLTSKERRSALKALEKDYAAAKSNYGTYYESGAAKMTRAARLSGLSAVETVQTKKPSIGKTDNGEVISVSKIEDISNGQATIKTSQGETVPLNIKDIKSENARALYSNAVNEFTDAASAQAFINNYDGGSVETYTKAFKDYYRLASTGMTLKKINDLEFVRAGDLSEKAQLAAVKAGHTAVSFKQGVVDFSTVPKTQVQQLQVQALDKIAQKTGLNIVVFDTDAKHEGFHRSGTNQIVVTLESSGGAILRTASHETYHYIQETLPENAKEISDFVINTLTKNKGKEWVEDRFAFYESQGYNSREAQTDELVADSLFDAFTNERAVKEFATENKSVAKKVLNHIRQLIADIKNIINKLVSTGKYDEIKAWKEDLAALDKLNNMFLDALDELAAKNTEAPTKTKNTAEAVKNNDIKWSKKRVEHLTESEAVEIFENCQNGEYKRNTYVPVSRTTPSIVIEKAKKEIKLEPYPLFMKVEKVQQMIEDEDFQDGGSRLHGIAPETAIQIFKGIFNPNYIFYQKDNNRVTVIVRLGKGKNAFVTLDKGRNFNADLLNGYEGGRYNVSVTVYYLDNLNKYKSNENNVLLYDKSKANHEEASGSLVPSLSNDSPYFDEIITQNDENVNRSTKRDADYLTAVKNGDMEAAQRLVDEAAKAAGYTFKLFHQTENDFTVFDTNHKGAGTGDYETPFGIFMKPTDSNIGLKGQKQMPLYAKIENPLVVHNRESLMRELKDAETVTAVQDKIKEANSDYKSRVEQAGKDLQNYLIEYRKAHPDEPRSDIYKDKGFNEIYDREDSLIEEWTAAVDELALEAKTAITEYLKNNGYDGVIIEEDVGSFGRKTKTYIALDNTQVKSSDPVTYDNNGNVVPLSKRFNEAEEDIRYSVKRAVDDNGNVYENTVVLDTNIFDKKKTRDWGKILQRFVYNNLVGKEVVLTDENNQEKVIQFAKGNERAKKDGAKNAHRVIDKLARKKDMNSQLAVAHSIEIISVMKPTEQKNDHSHQWLDENGWDYYKVILMQRNGKLFEATINVAKAKDGRNILYDINKIKEIGDGVVFSKTESSQRNSHINSDFDDEIVTQNKEFVNYSLKRESSISEEASNYILDTKEYQDVLGVLEKRFNTLGKVKLSPKAIDRYAGKLLQKTNSNYSREQLTERLTALFDFIANSREVTWEEVTELAANIAKDMLTESQTLDRSMQQEYADVLNLMRESRVYISPEVRAEINHNFGSLEAFRRRLGSKLKITVTDESAVPLDVFWRELAENRPEMFEEDTNYLDMPSKLVDFFEMTSPQYINPYNIEMDMDEAAYDFALQMYDEYFEIPEVKTEAQKYSAKLQMLKGHYNAKIKEIHNSYRERIKEIRTELKAENKKQIAVTKELYRSRNENYRNKQKETRDKQRLRAQIYRSAQNLTDKLVNPTDTKHIPQELISAVNDFCKTINESGIFSPEKANKLRRAFKNIDENSADPDANLSTMYNEEITEMLEQLHDDLAGRRLGELNVNELARVKIAASYFTHIVAMSNRTFSDNIKEKLLDLQSNAILELDKISPDRKRIKTEIQKGLLKPVTFFELLESPTLTRLYDNIRQGEGKWYRTVASAKNRRQEAAKKYNYKSWKNDKVTFKPERLDGEIVLSVDEALSIYATANREQGVEHIRLGGIVREEDAKKKLKVKDKAKSVDVRSENIPITVNDMVEITSQLTKEQKAYADNLIEFMSKDMAALGNEVSMRLFGIKKFNEKKYFPLKSASNFIYSKPAVENDARIKHMSMTKQTIPKANNPVVIGSFTETVMNHCNDMALYYSFCLPLEDFNRVYNFKTQPTMFERPTSIKQKIDRAFGAKANGYIKQLLTDINGGVTQQAGAGFVNKMISLAKKNAVFGSLSVAVQQPSAVARAFLYIDPKYFVQSTFSKRDWNELKTYAPVAGVKEMGYFDTNIGRQAIDWMTEDKYEGIKEKAFALFKDGDYRDGVLSFLPAYMDQISWGHIWNAVKKETAHNNPDMDRNSEEFLKLAGERFTYVIDRTQVYDSVFARSEWMRSKDTGVKVATAFMSEPLTNYNMLYSAMVKARHGDKKFAAKAVSAYLVSVVFNSILKSLVTAGRDDDEDNSYWEKYLSDIVANFIDEPFGMIPYLKDFISLMQGYDSSRMDTQVLAELVKTVQTVSDSNKTPYEKVKSVFGTFGIALGVPIKNLWRDSEMVVKAVEKIFKGEFEPTTEQGIINAIKEDIGVDTSTAYEQVVDAYINSDDKHYNKVYDNLIDSKSEKAIVDGIKTAAKDKFQSREITEDEATRVLTDVLDLSDNDAYWLINEWNETANGEEYAKYNNLAEAVRTGKDLNNVIDEYLDHGVTKKTLAGQITKTFKREYIELYRTNRAEASALRRRLLDAYVVLGYDRDDKSEDIADWLED